MPRTLVLCFDGTSNEYDQNNTNIVKLFASLKKNNPEEQLCYYQPGIGTWLAPGLSPPIIQRGEKTLDLALATYLDTHLLHGYRFIMDYYCDGDKICLFGLSRGAYTARALAGMLHKVGLLPRGNLEQIHFAYKMYIRDDEIGRSLCRGFKKTYSQEVTIEFVGVWDTVSSVGIINMRMLPFSDSNTSIRTFRHALALDEHRTKFQPILFYRGAEKDRKNILKGKNIAAVISPETEEKIKSRKTSFWRRFRRGTPHMPTKAFLPSSGNPLSPARATDVLEVWFAGCHSDVGGGVLPNEIRHGLSNISLRWMMRQIVESNCGIQLLPDVLEHIDIRPLKFEQTEPLEDDLKHDKKDTLEPIHDELSIRKAWWLLEVVPTSRFYLGSDCRWRRKYRLNMGKGRVITSARPLFHISVRDRMGLLGYVPRAKWQKGSERYVY